MEAWIGEALCLVSCMSFLLGYMYHAHLEGPLDHVLQLVDGGGDGVSAEEIGEIGRAVIQYKGLSVSVLQDAVLRLRRKARLFRDRALVALAAELMWVAACFLLGGYIADGDFLQTVSSLGALVGIVLVFFCFISMARFAGMSKSLQQKVHLFEDYGSVRCHLCGEPVTEINQHGTYLVCLCETCKAYVDCHMNTPRGEEDADLITGGKGLGQPFLA